VPGEVEPLKTLTLKLGSRGVVQGEMSERSSKTLTSIGERHWGPPSSAREEGAPTSNHLAAPVSTTRIRATAISVADEPLPEPRRQVDMKLLLGFSVKSGASDLHLVGGEPASLRIHGVMQRIKMKVLSREDVRNLVVSIMDEEQQAQLEAGIEVDFSYALEGVARFRVNAFIDQCGVAAVLRTIPSVVPTIESLGLPLVASKLCERDSGLVLVTGPTGSGKSTTLAAMIGAINLTYPGRIITIEDPIEFTHRSAKSVVSQRELGLHTKSYASALRAALREDPDVILVGEMRDLDTISLAITAAETGHLVFSTLHAPSAAQTVDRMIDVFPAGQQGQIRAQLADCLAGVMTQRLLPKVGGGRVAALEVLVGTPAVRALVRDGKAHQLTSIMQVGVKDGMRTMEAALIELLERGLVKMEDVAPLMPQGRGQG
jgi:twitching motility protein PilT